MGAKNVFDHTKAQWSKFSQSPPTERLCGNKRKKENSIIVYGAKNVFDHTKSQREYIFTESSYGDTLWEQKLYKSFILIISIL